MTVTFIRTAPYRDFFNYHGTLSRNVDIAIQNIYKDSDNKEIQAIRHQLRQKETSLKECNDDVISISWIIEPDATDTKVVAAAQMIFELKFEDETLSLPFVEAVKVAEIESVVENIQADLPIVDAAAEVIGVLPAPVVALNPIILPKKQLNVLTKLMKIVFLPVKLLMRIAEKLWSVDPEVLVDTVGQFFKEMFKLIINVNKSLETINGATAQINKKHINKITENLVTFTGDLKDMTGAVDKKKLKESLENVIKLLETVSTVTESLGGQEGFGMMKQQLSGMFAKANLLITEMLVDGPMGIIRGLAEDRREDFRKKIAEMQSLSDGDKADKFKKMSDMLKILLLELGREEEAAALSNVLPRPIQPLKA